MWAPGLCFLDFVFPFFYLAIAKKYVCLHVQLVFNLRTTQLTTLPDHGTEAHSKWHSRCGFQDSSPSTSTSSWRLLHGDWLLLQGYGGYHFGIENDHTWCSRWLWGLGKKHRNVQSDKGTNWTVDQVIIEQ